MSELISKFTNQLIEFLTNSLKLSHSTASMVGEFMIFIAIVLIAYLAYLITVRVMRNAVVPIMQRTKNKFDDILVKNHLFRNISYLVPALILFLLTDETFHNFPFLTSMIHVLLEIVFVVIFVVIATSILNSINDFYDRFDFAKDVPIRGLIQIIKIVFYIVGLIAIVSILFDKDLGSLALGLGTMSAVLMLIFRDPILGFVGGMQLSFNKMLSIGDWITMPKFGADGTVFEINLTTVKVQNWDKTIVTIPTYSLITDSFQNWKGMEASGGRRIKRSVNIDMKSITFCTPEMLKRFGKIQVLGSYIETTENRIEKFNKEHNIDPDVLVNGRRQTNIGVFRAYLEAYLSNRNDINTDLTFMVRQLQPTEKGLPIEIYVFTNTTKWVAYEGIQSDIFDHVLAVIPQFDLRVYQFPSGGEVVQP